MIDTIAVAQVPEQSAAAVRGRARPEEIGAFVGPAFGQVLAALDAQGLAPVGPPFCRYSMGEGDMDASGMAAEFGMTVGFPCAPSFAATDAVEAVLLPGGDAVVAVHVGRYEELGEAYQAVESWFAEHGLERAGDPWETYLDGPDADPHRTVLTAPCRPGA